MSHLLGKLIRSAVINYNTEPLNIITYCTHEAYETNLALTNHNFFALQGGNIKNWVSKYRQVPPNYTIFDGRLGDSQVPLDLDFDLILSQNKFAHFDIAKNLQRQLNLPIISLEHCIPGENWNPDILKQAQQMVGDINVMTTTNSRQTWGFPEDDEKFPIIYHGIDTNLFKPSDIERTTPVLSVCNAMASRPLEVGWELWQQVAQQIVGKIKLVGDNPGISIPAESVEALVQEYQCAKIFLNSTQISTIPTCLLEAMACGCAVVTTGTCAIPEIVKHDENGFITDNATDMVDYINQLLEDEGLRNRLGQAARQTIIDKFDLDRHVQEWDDVLRRTAKLYYKG